MCVFVPFLSWNNNLLGITSSLELFAFFMLTGVFSTLLLPETKQKTLEELSNENQQGFVSGIACRSDEEFVSNSV